MGAGEKEEQEGQGGKEGGRGVLITPHYSLKEGKRAEGEWLSHLTTQSPQTNYTPQYSAGPLGIWGF